MANTFIKPTVIVRAALGLLQRQIVLPALVWTDAFHDFSGAYNDTISIRVPGRLTARTRDLRGTGGARTITLDNLTETKVDVTLDTDIYSAVPVTDEELTLDIVNFGAQVLAPQVRAVAEGLENGLVTEMQQATYETTVNFDNADPYGSIVDARKALNDADVPFAGRALVVGSAIEAAILKDDHFSRYDAAAAAGVTALTEAKLGRIAGFDVYTSNALNEDEAFAFHMTAFVLASRAPVVPDGATFGQSESYQGLAMRWLRDYDFSNVQDRSLVDAFTGTAHVEDDGAFVRAVRLEMAGTALASIDVTPATSTKAAGSTTQLTVTGSDGADLTAVADYTTSDATKATVDDTGLITFVATGSATITASYGGHTDTCAVTVS